MARWFLQKYRTLTPGRAASASCRTSASTPTRASRSTRSATRSGSPHARLELRLDELQPAVLAAPPRTGQRPGDPRLLGVHDLGHRHHLPQHPELQPEHRRLHGPRFFDPESDGRRGVRPPRMGNHHAGINFASATPPTMGTSGTASVRPSARAPTTSTPWASSTTAWWRPWRATGPRRHARRGAAPLLAAPRLASSRARLGLLERPGLRHPVGTTRPSARRSTTPSSRGRCACSTPRAAATPRRPSRSATAGASSTGRSAASPARPRLPPRHGDLDQLLPRRPETSDDPRTRPTPGACAGPAQRRPGPLALPRGLGPRRRYPINYFDQGADIYEVTQSIIKSTSSRTRPRTSAAASAVGELGRLAGVASRLFASSAATTGTSRATSRSTAASTTTRPSARSRSRRLPRPVGGGAARHVQLSSPACCCAGRRISRPGQPVGFFFVNGRTPEMIAANQRIYNTDVLRGTPGSGIGVVNSRYIDDDFDNFNGGSLDYNSYQRRGAPTSRRPSRPSCSWTAGPPSRGVTRHLYLDGRDFPRELLHGLFNETRRLLGGLACRRTGPRSPYVPAPPPAARRSPHKVHQLPRQRDGQPRAPGRDGQHGLPLNSRLPPAGGPRHPTACSSRRSTPTRA